jgi:hypothetical protein
LDEHDDRHHDLHLRRLLDALPERVRRAYLWLIRPEARWVRIPAAVALILGGVFAFLPILGLWMLPIGALLIGEDIPPVRRFTLHLLRHALAWWDRMRARRGDGA